MAIDWINYHFGNFLSSAAEAVRVGPMQLDTHALLSNEDAVRYEQEILGNDDALTGSAMFSAGEAVGRAILDDFREIGPFPENPAVLILAGKGHNAGDAFHAACVLCENRPEARVVVLLTSARSEMKPLSQQALDRLIGCGAAVELLLDSPENRAQLVQCEWDIAIDGLLGISFRSPLSEELAGLIRWANTDLANKTALRAAVDLPSGLDENFSAPVFQADFSYATGFAKLALFRKGAQEFTGRIRVLPIAEIPAPAHQTRHQVVLESSLRQLRKLRPANSNKRDYGHVLILAGSLNMPGAALMATQGALHAGAGLVTTFSPSNIASRIASAVPEAMWQPLPVQMDGSLEKEVVDIIHRAEQGAQVLLVGPGLRVDRASMFALSRIVRECLIPLVIDASALTPDIVSSVLARPSTSGPVVITPHWGEYQRLNNGRLTEYEPEVLMQFCQKFKLTTLLKGPVTRICDGKTLLELPVGGPVLARGGSGDILAGMVATLLAQNPESPLQATAMAGSWHGAAATAWAKEQGSRAVRTTGLLDYLAPVTRH